MESSSSISLLLFFMSFCCMGFRAGEAAAKTAAAALYVLGDSLVDVGNNNYLATILKANFLHNGVDFAGGRPTGRFSNGRNAADFFAEGLGLPSPPPFLSINRRPNQTEAFLKGINFASGGAGVLDSTNRNLCLSMNKQIEHLAAINGAIEGEIGAGEALKHLSNSLFVVNIGSNDILGYLMLFNSTPPINQYVDSMVSFLGEQLQRIYSLGARKLLFIGTGPIGCCPFQRNSNGECNITANSLSNSFNKGAVSLLREMKSKLPNFNYSFFNTSLAVSELIQNSANHGFTEVKAACCGLGGNLNANIPCTPVSYCCKDRRRHIFWDFAHPTEATVQFTAKIVADGSAPYVYPINMRQLSTI
ncbi:GDSL esterase/lipase [Apostasia shenzhenica]|uniref:GDSL esterase/lipase n=1 Tax=Apostasia shenzhenica TaxID=1088818 RepID=A0A2H9ZZC3_9ASPA|nr:GDSL esterase/lipase [Apostasia shenzhenica]